MLKGYKKWFEGAATAANNATFRANVPKAGFSIVVRHEVQKSLGDKHMLLFARKFLPDKMINPDEVYRITCFSTDVPHVQVAPSAFATSEVRVVLSGREAILGVPVAAGQTLEEQKVALLHLNSAQLRA